MKIYLELEHNFGHPSNDPTQNFILEEIVKQFPVIIKKMDTNLVYFKITSVKVTKE